MVAGIRDDTEEYVVRPMNRTAPPKRAYCEQLDATVVTDCTLTCWLIDELLDVDVPEVLLDGELLLPDASVPVISTFSPTCFVNSLS